jgi:peroxiredoxin
MIQSTFSALALASLLGAVPAAAALKVGDKAPEFQAQSILGDQVSTFSLAESLKKGPVVLYFFPKAFTKGCTYETRMFADASDQFKALGATIIGISHDDIPTLAKFDDSECSGKFPMAADPDQAIMKSYDAVMPDKPNLANRTTYVITPDDKVLYTFTDIKADQHVPNALAALKQWKDKAGD